MIPVNVQPVAIQWFIDGNSSAQYIGNTINQPVVNAFVGTTEPVMWCVKVYDVSGCFTCWGSGGPPYATPGVDALITPVCGGSGGAIDITATQGAPPFTFQWSNGATTEDVVDVPAGTYSVTVTSFQECDEIFTFEVPSGGLTLSADITPNTACTAPNGAVALTVGNPGPFTYQWSNGATTAGLTGVAAGSYTVTVTSSGGCSEAATYTVPDGTVPIGGLATTTGDAFCNLPTGSIGLEVVGGAAPFTYAWSNGATTQGLAAVAPGTYTVTATAANGCTATAAATVANSPGQPSLTADTTPNTACAPPNGGIDLSASPPAPAGQAYTFAWPGGATTEDLSLLPGGTYTVTVTLGSCTATASYGVGQETVPPAPTATGIPATCGQANGGVEMAPGGGTPPYTFAWSNGAQTQNLAGLAPGNYSVTVMDALGCTGSAAADVEASGQNFSLSATATANTGCAAANGSLDLSVTPGGAHTYLWSNGATVEDPAGLAAGPYSVTVTQAGSGCTSAATFNVPDGVPLPDTTYVSGTNCDPAQTGVFEETLASQNGCDSVVISNISLAPSDTAYVSGTSCDPANTGVFEETLTNQYGCDSVIISDISLAPSDTTFLSGTNCDPAAVGVFEEIFTSQNGCDSVVVTNVSLAPSDTSYVFGTNCDPAAVGVFEEVLTNQYGCDSLVVTDISFSQADTTEVFGTSCDPTAVGIFEEVFMGQFGCDSVVVTNVSLAPSDTVFVSGTNCDPAQTGVFEEVFTNQFGCDSLVVTSISFSQADTTGVFQTTCDPNMAGVFEEIFVGQNGCDSLVITNISLAPSDTTYISGTTCDMAMAGVFTNVFQNQHGCDSTVTVTVSLLPSDGTALSTTTCDPAAAGVFVQNLTNQHGCDSTVTTTVTLLPDSETALSTTTCDPTQAGVFTQIFTNQNGCDSTVTTTITLAPPPELALAVSDFNGWGVSCAGGSDGSISATATGAGPFVFAWPDGSSSAQIAGLQAGAYPVTVTGANGCTASATANLVGPPPLQISLAVNGPGCFGESTGAIFAGASGGAAPYLFSLGGPGLQATGTFENLASGTYEITALDANGCTSAELVLINAPVPVGVELGGDLSIGLGGGAVLRALVNVPYASLASLVWEGLDSTECPTCPEQEVFPIVTTAYSVSVVDSNGCTGTDGLTVFVDRRRQVFVPNAFSPNGDGTNDVLYLFARPGLVRSVRSFLVFDRWGGLAFRGENLLPNNPAGGWDGTSGGRPHGPGVFVWWAEVEFVDGAVETFEGGVTLVR